MHLSSSHVPRRIQSLLSPPLTHLFLSKNPMCLLRSKRQDLNRCSCLVPQAEGWSTLLRLKDSTVLPSSGCFRRCNSQRGLGVRAETWTVPWDCLVTAGAAPATFKLSVEIVSLTEKYKDHPHQTLNFNLLCLSQSISPSLSLFSLPLTFLSLFFSCAHTVTHTQANKHPISVQYC